MRIKENKYIKGLWNILPHLIILVSFIIIAWSLTQSKNLAEKTAKNYIQNSYSEKQIHDNKIIENIYFFVIPGIVVISDVIIIKNWKKKFKEN